MMKQLKRFVAITISMVMAFQFCTNDFYLYAETGTTDPEQTESTSGAGTEETVDTSDPGGVQLIQLRHRILVQNQLHQLKSSRQRQLKNSLEHLWKNNLRLLAH